MMDSPPSKMPPRREQGGAAVRALGGELSHAAVFDGVAETDQANLTRDRLRA
jgi:hypothetical protein